MEDSVHVLISYKIIVSSHFDKVAAGKKKTVTDDLFNLFPCLSDIVTVMDANCTLKE